MRFIDLFTPETLTYAARLRALRAPVYGGFTFWELLPVLEPGTVVHRAYEGYEDAVVLARREDGRWLYVHIAMPFSARHERHLTWSEHSNDARLDLMFKSFLNRTEAATLPDLFEVIATDAVADPGEWASVSVPMRLACMVLTLEHPDAEPVKMLYGLDGFSGLRKTIENEDVTVDDINHLRIVNGRPVEAVTR